MASDTSAPVPRNGVQAVAPDSSGDLLARVAAGDPGAFEQFYDTHAPRVFGLTRRVLCNHSMAEEVTQDVMIELWRTAARYDPARGSLSSWILTVAHRRAIDRVRAETAGQRRERAMTERCAVIGYDIVSETVIRNDEAQQLRACLPCLTPLERETLYLAYYDGHTYPEVARLLGISLPAVKARIRAALHRLREHVAYEARQAPATKLSPGCHSTSPHR